MAIPNQLRSSDNLRLIAVNRSLFICSPSLFMPCWGLSSSWHWEREERPCLLPTSRIFLKNGWKLVCCLPLLRDRWPRSSHCHIGFFALVRMDGTWTVHLVGVKPPSLPLQLSLLSKSPSAAFIPEYLNALSIGPVRLSLSPQWSSTGEAQFISKQVFLLFMFLITTGIFKSTCSIDVRWFPFDIQRCDLKFGSWTYGGWSLDLKMLPADITSYTPNGEWDLLGKRPCEVQRSDVQQCIRNVIIAPCWGNDFAPFLPEWTVFCFVSQRFRDGRTSVTTIAARSRILTSPSPWWCGDGPSTTASTCSSRVSWSPFWPCSSSCCPLTRGRRSHWVGNTNTHTPGPASLQKWKLWPSSVLGAQSHTVVTLRF